MTAPSSAVATAHAVSEGAPRGAGAPRGRAPMGGAVGEIHELGRNLICEAKQVCRARARYLYPASRLRCQDRGNIIRVRSENAKLLVNAGIIIKTLGQATDGFVVR